MASFNLRVSHHPTSSKSGNVEKEKEVGKVVSRMENGAKRTDEKVYRCCFLMKDHKKLLGGGEDQRNTGSAARALMGNSALQRCVQRSMVRVYELGHPRRSKGSCRSVTARLTLDSSVGSDAR